MGKKKTRLRAKVGLTYPDPASMKRIKKAGGIHKMSPDERDKLKFKRVHPGDWCDDFPTTGPNKSKPRKAALKAGRIEKVEVESRKKSKKKSSKRKGS